MATSLKRQRNSVSTTGSSGCGYGGCWLNSCTEKNKNCAFKCAVFCIFCAVECAVWTPAEVLRLEFRGLGRAGEGDDVADVGHAGDEEHQAFEA